MSRQLPADGAEPDRAAEYERARREQLTNQDLWPDTCGDTERADQEKANTR